MTFVPDKGCLQADTAEVCSAFCKTDGFLDDGGQHPFSTNTVTKPLVIGHVQPIKEWTECLSLNDGDDDDDDDDNNNNNNYFLSVS